MSNKIEHVARSIYEADGTGVKWDDLVPDKKLGRTQAHCDARKEREYRRAAAAIAATSPPTPKMLRAMAKELHRPEYQGKKISNRRKHLLRFKAAIRAALEENK